ncbi:hypothetical protein KP509_22G063500 [Ceratopteris richardii]|uniref:Uncharacterized protein n=1 Tax=Ceratopteris richardii TaxID=49495 RepID=A0A8T2S7R3_CERRI|nr:hypothetical protein KP509_22G063500 [Ceratopteris richardii]
MHAYNGGARLLLCSFKLKTFYCSLIAFVVLSCIIFFQWHYVSYFLRPVWDTPPPPFHYLVHYYSPNLSIPELCSLHGWRKRHQPRRVFDAIIFNHELDLLEIRWRELDSVVSKFLIVESNTTFTGLPKPLFFAANRHRFRFADLGGRIIYRFFPGRKLRKQESPFEIESKQRRTMSKLLAESGIHEGDLVIMSDTDEIPSAHTIRLLQWCDDIPPVLHLQMSNYLYSFEFYVDKESWRAAAAVYRRGSTYYNHGRKADTILPDAGWHCSFCFRHIRDFVHKMRGYSHADRVKDPSLLKHARIQEVICNGDDIFGMLPEEYTFKKLVAKLGAVSRSYSAVNLPGHLLKNPHRFRYLLPGNCFRELS